MKYRLSSKALITIGHNIKKYRKAQNKSQETLAAEAGIESSYFAKIERGEANPSLEIIYTILKALNQKSSNILPF
jgi:transcriptional regulator with XRE-family HTH domain